MSLKQKKQELFTYSDYLSWNNEERYELIHGEAYCMSPSPSFEHQQVVLAFASLLREKLKGQRCTPVISPIDVVLSDTDVVQPDLVVLCDREKIKNGVIFGAPDLVIEVLSPSTSTRDRREKKYLYEQSGVKEYILIDPIAKNVERYFITENKYNGPELFGMDEILTLKSLNELEVKISLLFD